MIWQRLKNLWYLSGLPKDGKGYPDEYERRFNKGESHAVTSGVLGQPKAKVFPSQPHHKQIWKDRNKEATVFPYKSRTQAQEIIDQAND